MRRKNQALSAEECEAVLKRGSSGVLAVLGDGGYPYAVPLSYAYADGRLFFHCAKAGHKLDAIAREPRVSFCVVDQDCVVPEEYTTYFRSVIVFGRASVVEDDAGRRAAAELLARKYCPEESTEGVAAEIDRFWRTLCILELVPKHVSGKEAIELTRQRG